MARKFFYVCAGLFLLAGAYALGARSASAQAPVYRPFGMLARADGWVVQLEDGSVYFSSYSAISSNSPATYVGNFWSSGPVNVEKHSLGELKAKYR